MISWPPMKDTRAEMKSGSYNISAPQNSYHHRNYSSHYSNQSSELSRQSHTNNNTYYGGELEAKSRPCTEPDPCLPKCRKSCHETLCCLEPKKAILLNPCYDRKPCRPMTVPCRKPCRPKTVPCRKPCQSMAMYSCAPACESHCHCKPCEPCPPCASTLSKPCYPPRYPPTCKSYSPFSCKCCSPDGVMSGYEVKKKNFLLDLLDDFSSVESGPFSPQDTQSEDGELQISITKETTYVKQDKFTQIYTGAKEKHQIWMQQNIPGSLQSGTPPSENKSTEQDEELEVSDQTETPTPELVPNEEIPTLEFSDDIGVSGKGTDQHATTTATAQEEQQLEGPSTDVSQDKNQETAQQTSTEDLQETSLIEPNIETPRAEENISQAEEKDPGPGEE